MVRQPVVAGQFYPRDEGELSRQVENLLVPSSAPQKVRAIIVPHAGYVYSGAVAGKVFAQTDIPAQVLLLGPNHHGRGARMALSSADAWRTPLGDVPVAAALRAHLCERIPRLEMDETAHEYEHSLEVMLPFLIKLRPDLEIVPIALRALSLSECLTLGTQIAEALKSWDAEVLMLASSDMNHFSSAETTEKLDSLAISAMTDYAPERLYRVVYERHISMCGVLPAVTVLQAARESGATSCRLLCYSHSGRVNHDLSSVVGYAGLSIQ
ncbi:MAG: AmmeMemoRadiSam system protein B [Desulfuromonadales bacterium]|nr:AmmeMemoRadiSam system protein B [Desulfuromonadales bacterium]MBN2793743.1 AmmeMemoRadiSam system protein B [Desulfuromonadales bacterium]